jgi:hypothetical protein
MKAAMKRLITLAKKVATKAPTEASMTKALTLAAVHANTAVEAAVSPRPHGCPQRPAALPHKRRTSPRATFKDQARGLVLGLALGLATSLIGGQGAHSAPIGLDLNRALQIGWYSLRVQNPFGTNYTGLVAIKSYNPQTKEFLFTNRQGQDVLIKAADISFIYFTQLPERADINVKVGDVRNIQITPYREFLYDIPPRRLSIQDGVLSLSRRWRIAEQRPFDVLTGLPQADQTSGQATVEDVEITRRIQLNYLGNHYLVETELVRMVTHSTPDPRGRNVPRPRPINFPIPTPEAPQPTPETPQPGLGGGLGLSLGEGAPSAFAAK